MEMNDYCEGRRRDRELNQTSVFQLFLAFLAFSYLYNACLNCACVLEKADNWHVSRLLLLLANIHLSIEMVLVQL